MCLPPQEASLRKVSFHSFETVPLLPVGSGGAGMGPRLNCGRSTGYMLKETFIPVVLKT